MAKKQPQAPTPNTIAQENATATTAQATSTGPERPQISSTDVDDFGLVVLSIMAITGRSRIDATAQAKTFAAADLKAIAKQEREGKRADVPKLLGQANAKANAGTKKTAAT